MEPVYVRNTIKKVWEPSVILRRPITLREPRTYTIVDINGKVDYRTREHLKPRSRNMPKGVNAYFELPIQPFTLKPPPPADIPSVSPAKPSTPVRAETAVIQLKTETPAKAMSLV